MAVVRLAGTLEFLIQRALEDCTQKKGRMMVQVVGQREATDLAESLTKGGHPAAAVTRLSRVAPPDLHLVGTAVVGVSVNIRPPPAVGVSSGVELVDNRGRPRLTHTTISTHTQQIGRYGRDGEASFYCPPLAGTGAPAVPYPNWRLYTSSSAAMNNFNKVYGLGHRVDQRSRHPNMRAGVGTDTSEVVPEFAHDAVALASLQAAYLFLGVGSSRSASMMHYATWQLTGLLMPGCEQLSSDLAGFARVDLATHRTVVGLLSSSPYELMLDGILVRHSGLRLVDYTVQPIAEK